MGTLALGHGPAPRVPQHLGKICCCWPEAREGRGLGVPQGSDSRELWQEPPWESWLSWLARWQDSLGTARWQAGAGLPWLNILSRSRGDGSSHRCSPGLPGQCAPSFPAPHKPGAAPHPSTPQGTAGDGAQPQSGGYCTGGGAAGAGGGTAQGCGAQRELRGGVKLGNDAGWWAMG